MDWLEEWGWLIALISIFAVISLITWFIEFIRNVKEGIRKYHNVSNQIEKAENIIRQIKLKRTSFDEERSASNKYFSKVQQELDQKKRKFEEQMQREKNEFRKQQEEDIQAIEFLSEEKSRGFPWLATAYADYFELKNLKEADYLEHKSHPALVSAEKVREIARKRRIIEKKLRIAQGIINYYQKLFPFLEEFLGNIDEEMLKKVLSRNIEEPIKEVDEVGIDPVRIYLSSLSEEEYQKLSSVERNQLALDRYWSKHKNNWQLGRDYERYIGYIYETNGYNVYYQGILEGFDDLGRDLICRMGKQTIIVQCKRWSQYKTIHEKHVNQLYGTVIKYIIDHPDEEVGSILYTTTKLSDRAKEFAKYLSIGVAEGFPLQKYSSIKCNVSRRNGEKIYHLPFDQQYDKTLIEPERKECYVETVEEAENFGFRRAWRWHGEEKK